METQILSSFFNSCNFMSMRLPQSLHQILTFGYIISFVLLWNKGNAQSWYNGNWAARKQITIDYAKVGTTGAPHTNFPVLININADNDLNYRARSDGYDILFTASDGTTKLSHERESYVSASGALVAWVKIPSLSASSYTVIYMYYGYSGSSDQQTINATWNSNYKAVWHLKETSNGTSNEFMESTSNAKHGTGQPGSGYSTQMNGKIGKAQDFANDRISIPNPNFGISSTASFSFWQNGDVAVQPASHFLFYGDDANTYRVASIACPYSDGTVYLDCGNNGAAYDRISKSASSSEYKGQWNYWVCTKNASSGNMKLYLNGSLWHSGTSMTNTLSTFNKFDIGGAWNGGLYDGSIDEFRISNVESGAGWILTEYNNQNSPATFYSVAGETLPVELLYFKSQIENNKCLLTWATASEIDNDFFLIEKSTDGRCFESIAKIKGSGTSNQILNYSFLDPQILSGTLYYRLKQVDFNGDYSYSGVNVVSMDRTTLLNSPIKIYPNPANEHIFLQINSKLKLNAKVSIFNLVGNQLIEKEIMLGESSDDHEIDIREFQNGIYLIKIQADDVVISKKFVVSK